MTKRMFDLFVSLIGVAFLSPALALLAVLVKIDSPGPVLYRGVRAGQFGQPFSMLKFRTMVEDADKIGGPSTSADDPRITRLGRLLRRYKLDELPQLINVVKGDMSLVGPRPEVMQEVLLYSDEEKLLLDVKPGITDWASVQFRNEGEILRGSLDPHQTYRDKVRPEKIRLGLEYVRSHSLSTDCKIILRTVKTILE